jgi:glycosyltransferase involved in cell wall biosynthesis
VVLGKLLIHQDSSEFLRLSQHVLTQANRALAQGVAVIADFNDDHFDHPVLGPHWRSAAALATLCTAGSPNMASAVARHARGPVVVVGDPIASPAGEPRVFRGVPWLSRLLSRLLPASGPPRLKLVWYGHPNNWSAMEHWARDLEALSREQPLLLWLVTQPSRRVQAWVDAFNRKNAPAAFAEWVQWDEETQWSYVSDADAVLLPSDPADPKLAVKSSNRLTDALNAGRYVVASSVPSYRPFDAYCSLTEEPAKALKWMIRNSEAALGKIAGGQQLSQELASVAVMADKWAQVAIDATSTACEQMAAQPLLVAGDDLRPAGSEPRAMTIEDRNPPGTGDVTVPRRGLQLHCSGTVPPVRPTLLDLHVGKVGKVSDKWEAYFHAYERLFSPLRDQTVTLLEIGVQNGGSLEVWSQYFANATRIIGCDVDPKCANLQYVDPRIEVVVGDATAKSTRMQVMEICDSFDIVIDDGSHLSSDIVSAFLSYFPLLKPGGLYVVEDTHALYRPVPGGGVLSGTSAQQFFKQCAELINLEHWKDQLPVETLMATFVPRREYFPGWLAESCIESIEFRNSMITIRKSEAKAVLGRRLVGGYEADVNPKALRHKERSDSNGRKVIRKQEVDYLSGPERMADEDGVIQVALLTLQSPTLPSIVIRLIEPMRLSERYRLQIASAVVNGEISVDYETLSLSNILIVHRDFPRRDTFQLLKKLKTSGKKMVYETDDAFHLIPETHSKAFHRKQAPYMLEFASLADVLVTSTCYLAKQYHGVARHVVIPNRLSARLWNVSLIRPRSADMRHVRVGLLGGSNHRDDFLEIREAFWQLTKLFPHVRWVAYGEGALTALQGLPNSNIDSTTADFNYKRHPERLAAMQLDLVLVPLVHDDFNRCISNLKFLEAGYLGLPGVYADLDPYQSTVTAGVDGLLASASTTSWVECASQLIRDDRLRIEMGLRAREKVLQEFMLDHSNVGWDKLLNELH